MTTAYVRLAGETWQNAGPSPREVGERWHGEAVTERGFGEPLVRPG